MVPHCPTCRCQRTAPLPSRPLDLEDIRTLRVVKLNPILTSDDGLIRDSLNGFSCRPSPLVMQPIQSMPLEVGTSYLCHDDVSSTVQERTVRYRSQTPPAQIPRKTTAASQRSPVRKGAKKKKAKKQRRQKSMTPDSTWDSSRDRDEDYDPRQFRRSRSPPREGHRSRDTPGGKSHPKRKGAGRARSPAPSPESRTPSPPRVTQATRERKKSFSKRGSPGRVSPPTRRVRTPSRSPPRRRTPPRDSPRVIAPPRLSSTNTYPIGVRSKSPGRECGSAIIRETLRAEAPPFHPTRPQVGMKTVPVPV